MSRDGHFCDKRHAGQGADRKEPKTFLNPPLPRSQSVSLTDRAKNQQATSLTFKVSETLIIRVRNILLRFTHGCLRAHVLQSLRASHARQPYR